MDAIADILMIAGALGAGIYCFVLSSRLRRFNDLDKGVGGAVALLSVQVDDLNRALQAAQTAASSSTLSLDGLTDRAESVARRLELLVAAMHDIPQAPAAGPEPTSPAAQAAGLASQTMPTHTAEPAPPPSVAKDETPEPVFRRHRIAAGGAVP